MAISIKKKSNKSMYKSKSSSRSRKHLNKSRKCRNKTRKSMKGGAKHNNNNNTRNHNHNHTHNTHRSRNGKHGFFKRLSSRFSNKSSHTTIPKPKKLSKKEIAEREARLERQRKEHENMEARVRTIEIKRARKEAEYEKEDEEEKQDRINNPEKWREIDRLYALEEKHRQKNLNYYRRVNYNQNGNRMSA